MLAESLTLSAALFTIGVIGVLTRRNAIIVFMCVELMLNAVNLSFVALSRLYGATGQVFVIFVMTVAAAEAAVGFRDQDAGEAHLGELLPQVAAETGRVIGVAQSAHMADRRGFAHELLRSIAEHGLFFVEVERHFVIPAKAGIHCSRSLNRSPPWRG